MRATPTIRCELIICTDAEARKINLADNRRLSDLALDDTDALVELLSYLDGDYEGTGWTDPDVERMITPPEPDPDPGDPPSDGGSGPKEHTCPSCGFQFTDE